VVTVNNLPNDDPCALARTLIFFLSLLFLIALFATARFQTSGAFSLPIGDADEDEDLDDFDFENCFVCIACTVRMELIFQARTETGSI